MTAEVAAQLDLLTGDELRRELRVRNSPWFFKTVTKPHVAAYVQEGWEVAQTNKTTVRLRMKKTVDQALEDDTWALLAKLGFSHMSRGVRFTIPVKPGTGGSASKQIDVLAADDETALVVECKANDQIGRRSLAKDLNEANGLQAAVVTALRQHFGLKKRIGWLFVTRNIVLGDSDKLRAEEYGIRILTENDVEYFQRLAQLIGPAARHQLQAEVFGHKEIEGLKATVPAVRGKIAGRVFYQFTIDPERLLKIAFISHRVRLDAETVGAYQRMLKPGRLRAIRAYIEAGGVFPTNIVVNFRTKRRFDLGADRGQGDFAIGTLYLPTTFKSAWVIDGQHRLYGFAGTDREASTQLPVLAFERLEPQDEARLFVDINNKQVKVPRNLLVDLTSELFWGSDDPTEAFHALLSRISAVLGREVGSPLRNRMVEEGEAQSPSTPVTITGLYEAIRKSGLVGTVRRGAFVPGPLYEKDDHSAVPRSVATLGGYLGLIANALPEHWTLGSGEGGYLCTNNGITALFAVLRAVVDHLDDHGPSPKPWQATSDEFVQMTAPFVAPIVAFFAKADAADVRAYRRQVGNVGQRTAALGMQALIHAEKPGFNPPGREQYIKNQDESGTTAARLLVPELQLKIQAVTLRLLRDTFGSGEDGWWSRGVPLKVRTEVAGRREASPERGDYEQYFELPDYRSIARDNWGLFEPWFAYGGGRGKDSQLRWFGPLIEVRNRTAHPERGPVSASEIEFIHGLAEHFDRAVTT